MKGEYVYLNSASTLDRMCCTCRQQFGTLRTNCLDCLDRTNAVQAMFGLEVFQC